MNRTIAVLLLASVIVAGGCRGGAEKREPEPSPPVVEVTPQVETPVEDLAAVRRQARLERLVARRAQIENLGTMLDAAEIRIEQLEAELEERLATKALEWNERAFQELQSIPELEEYHEEGK